MNNEILATLELAAINYIKEIEIIKAIKENKYNRKFI